MSDLTPELRAELRRLAEGCQPGEMIQIWTTDLVALLDALDEKDAEIERLKDRQRDEPIFHCQTHMCGHCGGCKAAGIRDENTALRAKVVAVEEVAEDWMLDRLDQQVVYLTDLRAALAKVKP